jgi:hypothetical protein
MLLSELFESSDCSKCIVINLLLDCLHYDTTTAAVDLCIQALFSNRSYQ